jgi:hypothetical protein
MPCLLNVSQLSLNLPAGAPSSSRTGPHQTTSYVAIRLPYLPYLPGRGLLHSFALKHAADSAEVSDIAAGNRNLGFSECLLQSGSKTVVAQHDDSINEFTVDLRRLWPDPGWLIQGV